MPGPLVHVGALLTCPHAGAITATLTSPPKVLVNGAQPVVSLKDLHPVAGCPFQIPVPGGTKPQPCVTVRLEPAPRVLINGTPAAILTPAAVCVSVEQIPQGPPNASPIQTKLIAA